MARATEPFRLTTTTPLKTTTTFERIAGTDSHRFHVYLEKFVLRSILVYMKAAVVCLFVYEGILAKLLICVEGCNLPVKDYRMANTSLG